VHEYVCKLELHAAKVALAPLLGAAKVTATPETGLPYASVAVATSFVANALLTLADWLAPVVAANVAAGAALTVKRLDVPLTLPEVILSVVLWAL
jgi:hypothetical protein